MQSCDLVHSFHFPPPPPPYPQGMLAVKRVDGVPTVFPGDSGEVSPEDNLLRVVYDKGPVDGMVWDDFDTVRQRVLDQWSVLPLTADNISASLKAKVAEQMRMRGKKAPK